jgi:CheY-like chemotaxis protein
MENYQAKIVVVDDDLQFRSITAKLLTHRIGEMVVSFESGDELLSHLRAKNHVDIILSDINMPEMSGFELLGLIKKQFPEKKCVMMSGDPQNEKTALASGADAFINKPFQIQEITELLESLAV